LLSKSGERSKNQIQQALLAELEDTNGIKNVKQYFTDYTPLFAETVRASLKSDWMIGIASME